MKLKDLASQAEEDGFVTYDENIFPERENQVKVDQHQLIKSIESTRVEKQKN